jgi:hypothetical protein
MNPAQSKRFKGLLWGLGLIAIFGLLWANWVYARSNPLDSPFLVQWTGVRGLVMGGASPYDPSSWQIADLLSQDRNSEKIFIFWQPFYIVFPLLPLTLIADLNLARAVWMLFLELSLALSLFILPGIRQWKPGFFSYLLLVSFVFLGLHSIQALAAGSTVILASLFLLLALSAISRGWDEVAGLSLVLASIQPEVMLPVIIFAIFWGSTSRRWRLLFWFLGGVILISLAAMFLLPNWPLEYLRLLVKYWQDLPGITLSDLFNETLPGIARQLTWGMRLAVAGLLLYEWFTARNKDFDWFLWTVGLTLSLTPWLGLPTSLENLVVLFIPVFIFQSVWDERIGKKDHWLPLVMMIIFWLGLWIIAFLRIFAGGSLTPGFLFPLPFVSLLGLYWVRWWYVRPLRRYTDPLKGYEAIR